MCIVAKCPYGSASGGRYPDGLCIKHANEWCKNHPMYEKTCEIKRARFVPSENPEYNKDGSVLNNDDCF